jgi:serine/threonine-protein kinase RsbW
VAAGDTITISSQVERIDDARRWVTDHVRAAGVDDDAIFELELALTEALANIVAHAYSGEPDHEIRLGVSIGADRIEVSVRDWGRQFERASYTPRDLDDPGEGGYGVYLIDELMDEVGREPQEDGGTLLTLTKNRKGVPDG